MASLTKGTSYSSTEEITNIKLHNLVDLGSVTAIVNADIDSAAQIAATKLAAIATASKVSGKALFNLASTPAGGGVLPVTGGGTGVSGDTYDADKVDGIDAAAAATANKLLALDANSKLPASITGDADTVDDIHAAATPTANKLLALGADSKFSVLALPNLPVSSSFNSLNVHSQADATYVLKATGYFNKVDETTFSCSVELKASDEVKTGYIDIRIDDVSKLVLSQLGLSYVYHFGSFSVAALGAGVHTIKLYLKSNTAGYTGYYRSFVSGIEK